jgi:hypothetical protein
MLIRQNSGHDSVQDIYPEKAVLRRDSFCRALPPAAIRLLVGLGLSALLCAQTASPPPENPATFQRGSESYMGNKIQPRWAGKYLVEVQDPESKSPVFNLTDSAGRIERVIFQLPDTVYIAALEYNLGTDGSIAALGRALNGKNGGASFIAWISPDRKHQTVVQSYPFVPETVAIAADGSIWSAGTLFDDDKREAIAYNVIRRYDSQGNLLASVAVAGLKWLGNPARAAGYSQLQASRDRVGWFTSGDQYIEFSLDGKEIGRFEGPPGWGEPGRDPNLIYWYDRFALSTDNQAALGGMTRDHKSLRVVTLDRRAQVWKQVSLMGEEAPDRVLLLGFDGAELVIQSANNLDTLVHWTRGAAGAGLPEAR